MDMFEKEDGMEFQYNFCYCSICDAAVGQRSFNNTFVTVLYKTDNKTDNDSVWFQYNFCYCSILTRYYA